MTYPYRCTGIHVLWINYVRDSRYKRTKNWYRFKIFLFKSKCSRERIFLFGGEFITANCRTSSVENAPELVIWKSRDSPLMWDWNSAVRALFGRRNPLCTRGLARFSCSCTCWCHQGISQNSLSKFLKLPIIIAPKRLFVFAILTDMPPKTDVC